jgi:hypothetical protein
VSHPRSATYVYCVARSDRPPELRRAPRGLPGAGRPRAVAAGPGVWLIVADAPLARYGEAPLARLVRNLDAVSRCAVAHSAVVAYCARRKPVLPLRLLTLFSSDDRARDQVTRRRRTIERRLTEVAGRAEWGVQARLDVAAAQRARRTESASPRGTTRLGPGARFLELRRRHRRAAQGLAAGARIAARALYRALGRHADEARQRPALAVNGGPTLLLDAAFLVRRARIAEFRRAVRAQGARAAGHGLRIRLTGPWPPYSFAVGRL